MFRDSEIISILNDLNRKINHLQSRPDGEIFKKLEDILEHCEDIRQKLDALEENCLRDDPEFRFQIKEAMKEYKEQTDLESYKRIQQVDKAKKSIEKKRIRKK